MKLIAGVDIGNSTTEVCIGSVGEDGSFHFLSGASRMTTGTKGTLPNVHGIKSALLEALDKIRQPLSALDLVRLNEAAPVIGDTAGYPRAFPPPRWLCPFCGQTHDGSHPGTPYAFR